MTTLTDIATAMMEDPSLDDAGWTALGRMEYVMRVMNCDQVRLNDYYDFSQIGDCDSVDIVHAAGHLASLQLQFLVRCHDANLISDEEYMTIGSQLSLDIDRITWHARHLENDEPTPPYFPFIN